MDIQFYGANCLVLTTKQARVVIDDTIMDLGSKKAAAKPGDIALFTSAHGDPAVAPKITIDQPGEYEVSGVSVYGIAARSHVDEEKQYTATMYKIIADDLRILVTGHVYPELSDEQLESIGMIDLMFVPVGGNGYTLDGTGALRLIKKIEPKLVVPTHYETPGFDFPVPQQELEHALKALAMEPKETTAKLKVRSSDLSDATQLVVLERQQ